MDLEERIDYMCHPGGVMHRTVRLESGWYKDAFGAYLGKLHNGEVAPSGQTGLILPIAGLLLGEYVEAAVYARLLLLPTSFFRDYSAGNLSNRIYNIWRMINAMVTGILGGGLTLVLSVIYFEQIVYYASSLFPVAALTIGAQVLIIARAVCSGRKIMILDEATSALDNITQQAVIESLDSLECTRIAIAHRLSTVQHCDRILVLDKGKICEEGTYDELIQKNGVFAELIRKQLLDTE